MLEQVYPVELKPMEKACNGAGKKHTEEGRIEGTVRD